MDATQLIAKYKHAVSNAPLGATYDMPAGEAVIAAGQIPDGATIGTMANGTLVYRGATLDLVSDSGSVLKSAPMDDARRADCLVKYAMHVSRRGMSMGA